ncbi:MAG: opacity protein-like surface antigen [Bacteroidia bacterium]|jgi:opacity protein-like surface antigen
MKSILLLVASAALAIVTAAPASAQSASGTMPELEGATWYNTPPLTTADLEDRAILFEVFRTW